GADFGTQLDSLQAALENAAALADQRGVVVGPTRVRKLEEALAFLEADRGVGIRIDKDVAMVEGGNQFQIVRIDEAVAEHVARHVADSNERRRLATHRVAADL